MEACGCQSQGGGLRADRSGLSAVDKVVRIDIRRFCEGNNREGDKWEKRENCENWDFWNKPHGLMR